jgi:hypothetical protein
MAAKELSRFFALEIVERLRASEQQITAGSGDARDAAIRCGRVADRRMRSHPCRAPLSPG